MNQPLNRNRLALVGGVTFLSPKVAFPCALIRYRLLCKTLGRVLRRLNPGESAPSCAAVCRLGQTSAGPFFLYAVCVCVCVCVILGLRFTGLAERSVRRIIFRKYEHVGSLPAFSGRLPCFRCAHTGLRCFLPTAARRRNLEKKSHKTKTAK